jgi:hypothetical protein
MPRATSSASSARNVTSGSAAIRPSSHVRSRDRIRGRRPPIGFAAGLPESRLRVAHFTTLDALMPNSLATLRRLSPASTRAIARSRRSKEYGLTIHAGLLTPSQHLESETRPFGNPQSIQSDLITF